MEIHRHIRLVAVTLLSAWAGAGICLAQTPGPSPAADEAALLTLWKSHLENTNDHAKVVAACEEFRKKSPNSLFRPVSDELAAWHLLKIGDTATSSVLLERALTNAGNPVSRAGSLIAKRWMTRLDREKVRAALKLIYRDEVEFPATLDAMKNLPSDKRGPFTDRWGQTWVYRLTTFKTPKLRDLKGQKYELQSAMLKEDSDVAGALTRPYGVGMDWKATRMISASAGHESVEFTAADPKTPKLVISVGTESGGISFPYIGSAFVVLANNDYWALIPRPR